MDFPVCDVHFVLLFDCLVASQLALTLVSHFSEFWDGTEGEAEKVEWKELKVGRMVE